MNIVVVILHYRDIVATRACLASLGRIASPPFSVILIDNGSGDGSGEALREWVASGRARIGRPDWPAPRSPALEALPVDLSSCLSPCGRILFLSSPVNRGFAGGNNLGLRLAADADYLWLLNADTVVTRESLSWLVRVAGSTERVGAVQSLLARWGSRRSIDASGQKITAAGVRNDTAHPPRGATAENGIPVFGGVRRLGSLRRSRAAGCRAV